MYQPLLLWRLCWRRRGWWICRRIRAGHEPSPSSLDCSAARYKIIVIIIITAAVQWWQCFLEVATDCQWQLAGSTVELQSMMGRNIYMSDFFLQPEPIYRLVPLTMSDANLRIANLKRATEDYIAQYSVCKCEPCQNGGTLALLDGKCHCLCQLLYEGLACQNFKADKSGHRGKNDQLSRR